MKIEYLARNYAADDAVRRHCEEKLKKVLKFLEEPVDAHVTLEVVKHRFVADVQVAHRWGTLQAREEADQMLEAVALAAEKVVTQAERARKKFKDRRRRQQRAESNGHDWPLDVIAKGSLAHGAEVRRVVVKSSRLPIKPMTIEEAALQLEGSKHEFVVFRDSDTERVSVLYKRRDENYGLIAPEF
jgi:putative sigma-54 modulation protein